MCRTSGVGRRGATATAAEGGQGGGFSSTVVPSEPDSARTAGATARSSPRHCEPRPVALQT